MGTLHTFLGLLQLFPPAYSNIIHFSLLVIRKKNSDKHFINFSRNLGRLGKSEEMVGSMAEDREVKCCTQSSHRP